MAFVEGSCHVFFNPPRRAPSGRSCLPRSCPRRQARAATVNLIGPSLGGALFGIGRTIPFLLDSISYLISTATLLGMRTPFQNEREADRTPVRARLVEGFRFLWTSRSCTPARSFTA